MKKRDNLEFISANKLKSKNEKRKIKVDRPCMARSLGLLHLFCY